MTCELNVFEFCLSNAAPVLDGNATQNWEFNFTIKAQYDQKCGSIYAHMDVVFEGYHYLGGVTVPSQTIIDTSDCGCAKTFTVVAPFDYTPGDV